MLLLVLSLAVSVAPDPALMQLHLMSDKGLNTSTGAVCLDGSDAGFYFLPTTTKSKGECVRVCQCVQPTQLYLEHTSAHCPA